VDAAGSASLDRVTVPLSSPTPPSVSTPTATIPAPKNRILSVRGAREHNLKNISLDLPRNKLIVVTGVSGSGKSSLAFDTIYAEGQRRFVESLSAYARQFLERMNKPDVDVITGIPPAIAIQQKTISRNPRSTVGTITEVYDYLRLVFGRIGQTYCVEQQALVRKDTPQSALEDIKTTVKPSERLYILFPLPKHADRSLQEELDNITKQGFFRITLPAHRDALVDLNETSIPANTTKDDVLVLTDRLVFSDEPETLSRLADSLELAFKEGLGTCVVRNISTGQQWRFSSEFKCSACTCSTVYDEPQPRLFSFNNPVGACPTCQGFGRSIGIDEDLVIPDKRKSLEAGAIAPFQTASQLNYQDALIYAAKKHGIRTSVPVEQLSEAEFRFVWNGAPNKHDYVGVTGFFQMVEEKGTHKMHYRVLASRYRGYTRCADCGGSRLKLSARQVYLGGKTLPALVQMTLEEARDFFSSLRLTAYQETIAGRALEEIRYRLGLLCDIGVGYLTLDRLAHTLSGGESQRINLATSIGSSLVGALYVLDEPSIGLHPRDTWRMMAIMERLRNLGNTVIVVEHDEDIMRRADMIVDMGPRAGEHGGRIVAQGTVNDVMKSSESLTGQYLSGQKSIPIPAQRNPGNGKKLIIREPREHNLKGDTVEIPLGTMTVLTGVSGSGKSTLVHEVLYNNLLRLRGEAVNSVGKCAGILGAEHLVHIEMIDQSPIGKSPRSTPATYTKAFDYIRDLYASTQAARQLGWKSGAFSFNVPGGRCETCQGDGVVKIEMQFLADLYLECEDCRGTRYKKEAHSILYNGKSIVDTLAMTVDEAVEFFRAEPRVVTRLQVLQDVGLGYIRLGQAGTTLSGGEAQRVKLASHLQERTGEPTLFIFDEPTTGLHFDDISKLIKCFQQLVARGHSLLIVEHNIDVMKSADWIIDLGPEAGAHGGRIVAAGTPEMIASVEASHTGVFLRRALAMPPSTHPEPPEQTSNKNSVPQHIRSTALKASPKTSATTSSAKASSKVSSKVSTKTTRRNSR
jgi:excinuclease ABC subunit A